MPAKPKPYDLTETARSTVVNAMLDCVLDLDRLIREAERVPNDLAMQRLADNLRVRAVDIRRIAATIEQAERITITPA